MKEDSSQSLPSTPWRVRLGLVAAFVVFGLAASAIYYMYLVTPQTDCNIQIHGNKAWDQAITQVALEHSASSETFYSVTLNAENQYSSRFFLSSGTYHIKIIDAQGVVRFDTRTFIPPGFRQQYNLALNPEAAASAPWRPASRPW